MNDGGKLGVSVGLAHNRLRHYDHLYRQSANWSITYPAVFLSVKVTLIQRSQCPVVAVDIAYVPARDVVVSIRISLDRRLTPGSLAGIPVKRQKKQR